MEKCHVEKVLEEIGKKWNLIILKKISEKPNIRFNQLNKELKEITPRMLSNRLKELEDKKLIQKKTYSEIPPRTEYKLTKKAEELTKCFKYLDEWAEKYDL